MSGMVLKKVMVCVVLTIAAASEALPCTCKLTPIANGMKADCANLDLTAVPSCVPNEATVLDFSGNMVHELNSSFTSDKPALRQLIAHRSDVPAVAANAFSQTPELLLIDLAHNSIQRLPAGLFDATLLLEEVDLSGNVLRSLPRGLFKKVPHLRRLDLTSNYLSSLPGDLLGGCGQQAILRVGMNHLTTLPAALVTTCSSMVELDASSNQMKVLQWDVLAAIGQLAGLRKLLLRDNPWQCNCSISPLAELLQTRGMDEEATCGGPPTVKNKHVVHTVSELDCAPLNASAPPAAHAPFRVNRSARPTISSITVVVVAAVATCCTLAAAAAFFIRRHGRMKPADRFSLVENS